MEREGCLSAGRGFVHINATGDIEPCPFAPYSDINLRDSSLKDALQSEFLKTIRQNHRELSETEGGCALWVKREWVRSLLKSGYFFLMLLRLNFRTNVSYVLSYMKKK